VFEIDTDRLIRVESPGFGDENLREIEVDTPIPQPVCIGQSAA